MTIQSRGSIQKPPVAVRSRSNKIGEVAKNPWGEVAWYFEDTREQFRIGGMITVVGFEHKDEAMLKVTAARCIGYVAIFGRLGTQAIKDVGNGEGGGVSLRNQVDFRGALSLQLLMKSTRPLSDVPLSDWNHEVEAIAYAWTCVQKRQSTWNGLSPGGRAQFLYPDPGKPRSEGDEGQFKQVALRNVTGHNAQAGSMIKLRTPIDFEPWYRFIVVQGSAG